jgi:predicted aspartyl protease
MQLRLKDNLPFVTLQIAYQGKEVEIQNVLVDTGSASTVLSADKLQEIGISPMADDVLHSIREVGGMEVVYLREVDNVKIEEQSIGKAEIEVGGMDYGFEIEGILGMDLLIKSGAVINLQEMNITLGELASQSPVNSPTRR